jgi:hypothetical protein
VALADSISHFCGHAPPCCNGAIRFKATNPSHDVDTAVVPSRHDPKVDVIELLEDMLEFMGNQLDWISRRTDADEGVELTARATREDGRGLWMG